MRNIYLFLFSISCFHFGFGQNEYLNHPIDVKNYDVTLELDDSTNVIHGYELITFELKTECDSFFIDLQSFGDSTGMKIQSPLEIDAKTTNYRHENNRLWIQANPLWKAGSLHEIRFYYSGIPETGLIIGENKFGNRTFFGDNWPNRAHHWFACVDHPTDKATIKYTVVVPSEYDCIATGKFVSRRPVYEGKKTKYEFVTSINLPTKVMVIGVADFVWDLYPSDFDFDVSGWAYPENAKEGISDMNVSVEVLEYFVDILGNYPFEKLANVQSTTQFGGMENAGNIFYDENAITGEGTMEALIAHEIAHQWFGNSASEEDWPHLWLSEGFATYLTDLYWEQKYGRVAMNERLINERIRVLNFAKTYDHPVVDTEYEKLMYLLNPNSYQKGAWFLHMLREEIGDSAFFVGIRTYYEAFQYSNATTEDFRQIMEEVSDRQLKNFFEQWLFTSGHPVFSFETKNGAGETEFIVNQIQKGPLFTCSLEVEVIYTDKTSEIITIPISRRTSSILIPSKKSIASYRYDPNVKLLYEENEN